MMLKKIKQYDLIYYADEDLFNLLTNMVAINDMLKGKVLLDQEKMLRIIKKEYQKLNIN